MTKQYRDAFFPGTEELAPDEMRITALGTGMPLLRPSQMSAGWLCELGNGDRFFFDMGTGCIKNFAALEIPYQDADKLVSQIIADPQAPAGVRQRATLLASVLQPLVGSGAKE